MTREVDEKKPSPWFGNGLTTKSLIVGLVLVMVNTIYRVAQPNEGVVGTPGGRIRNAWLYANEWPDYNPLDGAFFGDIYFLISIFALLVYILRMKNIKIKKAELSVIIFMVLTSQFVAFGALQSRAFDNLVVSRTMSGGRLYFAYGAETYEQWAASGMAPWWIPSNGAEIWEPIREVRTGIPYPIPWAEFTPIIFQSVITILLMTFIYAFMGFLFVEPFNQTEMLPFPDVTPIVAFVDEATSGKPRKFLFGKWMLIGIVIALILDSPKILFGLDYYNMITIEGATAIRMAIDTQSEWLLVAGLPLVLCWDAFWIGAASFVPIATLGSVILAAVAIEWIFIQMRIGLGYMEPSYWSSLYKWTANAIARSGLREYNFLWSAAFGAALAACIYTFWIHRKTIASVIRGERETEFPYQKILGLMIVSLIVYLGWSSLLGARIAGYIPSFILGSIVAIGYARLMAEMGFFGMLTRFMYFENAYNVPAQTASVVIDQSLGGTINTAWQSGNLGNGNWATLIMDPAEYLSVDGDTVNGLNWTLLMDNIRLGGKDTTATRKEMLLSGALTWIVSMVIGSILVVYVTWTPGAPYYYYSEPHIAAITWWGSQISPTIPAGDCTSRVAPWPLEAYYPLIIFLVVCLGCYWMRRRYSWFFFNPIALLFVAEGNTYGPNYTALLFMPILIALIVKVFIGRVFGPSAIQEKLYPAAAGMLIPNGMILVWWAIQGLLV